MKNEQGSKLIGKVISFRVLESSVAIYRKNTKHIGLFIQAINVGGKVFFYVDILGSWIHQSAIDGRTVKILPEEKAIIWKLENNI